MSGGGGRLGLWVCASKSGGFRGQEYLRVQVRGTEPDSSFHLSCLPSLSEDPGQRPSVLQAGDQDTVEAESGAGMRWAGKRQLEPLTGVQRKVWSNVGSQPPRRCLGVGG